MKKTIFLLMILSVLSNPFDLYAQDEGQWEGKIFISGSSLNFEINFDKQEHGVMNVPAQGAFGLRLNKKEIKNDSIFFLVDSGRSHMRFKGKITHKDSIRGKFLQSGMSGEFELYRQKAGKDKEHSGIDREVKFHNDTIQLAGTLSLPDTNKQHPAVIMISGSGQQNRDENVFGFKVFKEMVPAFINKDIAVLRYDDRGAGDSDFGNVQECDTRDFAEDAKAVYKHLKQNPHIDNDKIGILGHSEGGIIAPMIADDHNVKFIILMAGPTIPGKDILIKQAGKVSQTMDYSEKEIAKQKKLRKQIYEEVMRVSTDTSKIKESFQKLVQANTKISDSAAMEKYVQQQMDFVMSPWFKFYYNYDPAPKLKALDIPVLAVFGGKDIQVDSRQNKVLIQDMIRQGKENYTLKVFPEANHLFQHAETGSIKEYQQLPKEFTEGFLKYITKWTKKTVR